MTVGPVVDRGRLRLSQTLKMQSNHDQSRTRCSLASVQGIQCRIASHPASSASIGHRLRHNLTLFQKKTKTPDRVMQCSYSTTIVNNLNFTLPYIPQSSPIRNLLDFSNRNFTSFQALLPLGHRWIIILSG